MRHSRRMSLGLIGVAVLTLGLLLSGCGSRPATFGKVAAKSTVIPLPSAAVTETPLHTFPTPDPATLAQPGCPPADGPTSPRYAAVGGLQVSIPRFPPYHNYPDALMPNNEPYAPYQVPLTKDEAEQPGAFVPSPEVNPGLSTGYEIQVCNQTTMAHTLTSLTVTMVNFAPSSGPITVWHLCEGGPYDAATTRTTTGCGGAIGGPSVDFLTATFADDSTGTSVPAKGSTQPAQPTGADLPIPVGAGESVLLYVGAQGLTSQGTYTLSFGVSVDGAAPITLSPSDGPFFIAPSAIVWTGTACKAPAMQAQIPAASQDTYYVCPPAA